MRWRSRGWLKSLDIRMMEERVKKTIVLVGRLDSKGKEYAYVKDKILRGGFDVVVDS